MKDNYDLVVIGSGPSGQKAAIQAAKLGKQVALIEKDRLLGGACVHRGTIPSKTLREDALRISHVRTKAKSMNIDFSEHFELSIMLDRLDMVLKAHDEYMGRQISRNNIDRYHGQASFIDSTHVKITRIRGSEKIIHVERVVIATGSSPRTPSHVDIDHEHIYDSDSILSMPYLPKTLLVLGGGVIASEYASIFQALGVKVIMVDRYDQPLGFLDKDLTEKFVHAFETMGGTWRGNAEVIKSYWDGSEVITELANGESIKSDKLLCAAGRVANTQGLNLGSIGLDLNDNGLISVDENLETSVPGIFAAGDVIGPPSLASASMEQGRRASCNIFGQSVGSMSSMIPTGIYGIPELSSVGLSECSARKQFGEIIVGKACFEEIARGQISEIQDGMLKIVCDALGQKVLGVMIVGEGATELIHIGQMAIMSGANVDIFVESIFNFPTLAEAYRVAALAVIGQRQKNSDCY